MCSPGHGAQHGQLCSQLLSTGGSRTQPRQVQLELGLDFLLGAPWPLNLERNLTNLFACQWTQLPPVGLESNNNGYWVQKAHQGLALHDVKPVSAEDEGEGLFGASTFASVLDFQHKHGIPCTGRRAIRCPGSPRVPCKLGVRMCMGVILQLASSAAVACSLCCGMAHLGCCQCVPGSPMLDRCRRGQRSNLGCPARPA